MDDPETCSRATEHMLTELVYELLDAHDDTAQLARDLAPDVRWAAHLNYLCALHRTGRAVLARIPRETAG